MAQETPTFSVRGEWAYALEIVKVLGAVVIAGVAIWRGGDALQVLDGFIRARIADRQLSDNLTISFNRLDTDKQNKVRMLVDVLDPLTRTTATDLDDKTIGWFRSIFGDGQPQG